MLSVAFYLVCDCSLLAKAFELASKLCSSPLYMNTRVETPNSVYFIPCMLYCLLRYSSWILAWLEGLFSYKPHRNYLLMSAFRFESWRIPFRLIPYTRSDTKHRRASAPPLGRNMWTSNWPSGSQIALCAQGHPCLCCFLTNL